MDAEAKIRVLIVDDHMVVIEGIKRALEKELEFEIAGLATDGLEAVSLIGTVRPDIVIMDISMPNLNGVAATQEIKKKDGNISVLIFSMYSEKEYIVSLFSAGISGYVLKGEPIANLILALKVIKKGGTYFCEAVQQILKESVEDQMSGAERDASSAPDSMARLSRRETEIFLLLADGLRPKDIADQLFISPKTVETHKYNIMEKLNVASIAEMTKMAIRKNLIKA